MAKTLRDVVLFLAGSPESATPQRAFMTYTVADGDMLKTHCLYEFPEPVDWTKMGSILWNEGVDQIETNEGIT